MSTHRTTFGRCLLVVAGCCALLGTATHTQGQDRAQPDQPLLGPEPVLRGPIHEAFGTPVVFNTQAGITAPRQPPEPIDELPPDQKPEGDAVWIAGYWFWDDQRQNFLWVSGLWRSVPPDHSWVPGYWTRAGDKYQWVSGFWTAADAQDVLYVPQPPESLETGPNSDPPSADHLWVPGVWIWRENRFAWRPGQWIAAQPDWVWMPAHYCWTPRGYLYVDGYWDFGLERRGLLFAPVYIEQRVLAQPEFVYTPTVVLDTEVLTNYLFVWPSRHSYFFGDYYDERNLQAGIYPWFAFHRSRYGYDPLFAYASWHYGRRDARWVTTLQERYWQLRENNRLRPPHTYADLRIAQRQAQGRDNLNFTLAVNLNDLSRVRNNIHLERVEQQHRQEIRTTVRDRSRIAQDRAKWELGQTRENIRPENNRDTGRTANAQGAVKWQVPRMTAGAGARPGRTQEFKPPARPSAPQADTAGASPPRGTGGNASNGRQLPGPEDMLRRPGSGRDTTGRPGTPPGQDRGRDMTNGRPGTPPPASDLPNSRDRNKGLPAGTERDRNKGLPAGTERDRNVPPGRDQDRTRDLPPGHDQPPGRDQERRNTPPRDTRSEQHGKEPPTGRDRTPPAPPSRERPKDTPPGRDRDKDKDKDK